MYRQRGRPVWRVTTSPSSAEDAGVGSEGCESSDCLFAATEWRAHPRRKACCVVDADTDIELDAVCDEQFGYWLEKIRSRVSATDIQREIFAAVR